ncbi:unnamed protein product [Dibothriocephalus latus]|uniref:C-type lectin domain-containing protein n=1 Tax=Dibothriocephalus latus TaxID=60516 RepID=A0A3P7LG00_DIBLA|nr:unnamed protein product [Dibothriocephalus latus]
MIRQTDVFSPFRLHTFLLLLLISICLLNIPSLAEDFTSSRQIKLDEAGGTLNFTWQFSSDNTTVVTGRRAAQQICENRGASLPKTHELRYFYKLLRQDITASVSNPEDFLITFYLDDMLDTTIDFPNEATGERMCIVLGSKLHEPIQYAETDGKKSCSQAVSVVVCRRSVESSSVANNIQPQFPAGTQSPQNPLWLEELKAKAAEKDQQICIQRPLFYTCAGNK